MSDGTEAIMDKSDAQHIASTDPLAVAELSNLRKIIENAEFFAQSENVDHDKFNLFKYYSFKVKFNGEVFDMLLNVGRSKYDQTYHIYDITKNGRTAGQASPGLGRPGGYALRNGSSNNSISQNFENSNTFDENISENVANLSENENSAEKVGAETEDRAENVHEGAEDAAENANVSEPESDENRAEEAEDKYSAIGIGIWARENVSGYGELLEPSKRIVRDTIRQARALGKSNADIKVIASVSARSGLNIVYDAQLAQGDGSISGNTVYLNPENSLTRSIEVLLGHEMFHKLFLTGGKRAMKLYNDARKLIGEDKAKEVRERYEDHYTQAKEIERMRSEDKTPGLKKTLSAEEKVIVEEEVAAHGAEAAFKSADAWEYILSEEPSFKQKVLGFFTRSAKDYSSIKELSSESRKFLYHYRKLFKDLEARNRGNNAYSRALETSEGKEKAVTSMNDENMQVSDRKYAIVAQEDGKLYVTATRKVIKSATLEGQRKEISHFFDVLLEGQPSIDIHTIEGDVLTISKSETADKARDNYKTVQNKRVKLSGDEFRVKLNAEAHIDELAEISTSKPQKAPDNKNHSFAKDGFTYRTAYFEDFDGKYYRVTLSIGNNGTVATVYNVGEIKENVPSSAKIIAVMGSKALDETFSDISIHQTNKKSNTFNENFSKKFDSRSALPLDESVKKTQFDIIQKTNPMWDEYHVGIRSVKDIRTWEEVLELNDESEGQFVWGDFSRADAERALKKGKVAVYSSYPIKNGVFVSTSYIQAEEYAGGRGGKVYSKIVPLDNVAWLNGDEGQYAKVKKDVGGPTSIARHALPKTDKKASDQGTKNETDPDKVTMSRGERQKQRANYNSDKVYAKKDVVEGLNSIERFKYLPDDVRTKMINDIWCGLNSRYYHEDRVKYNLVQSENILNVIKNEAYTEEQYSKYRELQKERRIAKWKEDTDKIEKIDKELDELKGCV